MSQEYRKRVSMEFSKIVETRFWEDWLRLIKDKDRILTHELREGTKLSLEDVRFRQGQLFMIKLIFGPSFNYEGMIKMALNGTPSMVEAPIL